MRTAGFDRPSISLLMPSYLGILSGIFIPSRSSRRTVEGPHGLPLAPLIVATLLLRLKCALEILPCSSYSDHQTTLYNKVKGEQRSTYIQQVLHFRFPHLISEDSDADLVPRVIAHGLVLYQPLSRPLSVLPHRVQQLPRCPVRSIVWHL